MGLPRTGARIARSPCCGVARLGRIAFEEPRRAASSRSGEGRRLCACSDPVDVETFDEHKARPHPGEHTLIVASYDNAEDAQRAFDDIERLHVDEKVPVLGAAVVGRGPDGRITLPESPAPEHHATRKGVVAGLALGAVFPPSLLAGGLAGAAAGALKDRHDRSLRPVSDAVANTLPPSSSGVIAITEWATMDDLDGVLANSRRVTKSAIAPHVTELINASGGGS